MNERLGEGSRVKHPAFGNGVIVRLHPEAYEVAFILHGIKEVGYAYDKWEIIEAIPAEQDISLTEIEQSLVRVLRTFSDISEEVPLGDRWAGGKLVFHPGKEGTQTKELPIETFFHKIVMVRDRLRVLEQRINSNISLDEEEKVNLQQYISRIYGSLTTFNALFKNKADYFQGGK